MVRRQKHSLIALYLAYFADYFSWGAAIAFLSVFITENTPFQHLFWDPHISVGIAFAAYPIGEVIGSPFLGNLSDWIGRKKVLMWGLMGSIFSMSLCAFSLWVGNFVLFLLSQLLVGFFSGKQAMAQAAIGEIQTGTKGQKLAFLSVLGGIAWVIGPLLGEALLQKPFFDYGGYIWPNILCCFVYLFSLFCTHFFFTDSYTPDKRPMSPQEFLHAINDVFSVSWKERLFLLFVLNLLGWYLFAVSLSDYFIQKFHLTDGEIGVMNSYIPLSLLLGGVLGTAFILRRWKAKNVLFWSLLAGSSGLFLLLGADKVAELWTYLAIPAMTEALIYPAYQTVLSDQTSRQNQGKLFGLIDATNGTCQYLSYLILSGIASQASILFSALLFLCSGALLPRFWKAKSHLRAQKTKRLGLIWGLGRSPD